MCHCQLRFNERGASHYVFTRINTVRNDEQFESAVDDEMNDWAGGEGGGRQKKKLHRLGDLYVRECVQRKINIADARRTIECITNASAARCTDFSAYIRIFCTDLSHADFTIVERKWKYSPSSVVSQFFNANVKCLRFPLSMDAY